MKLTYYFCARNKYGKEVNEGKHMGVYWLTFIASMLTYVSSCAQTAVLSGKITADNTPIEFANIVLMDTQKGTVTDSAGFYRISGIKSGTYKVLAFAVGFERAEKTISLKENDKIVLNFDLISISTINEVVVSGTLKEVSKLESPVPIEVFTAKFFNANPTPSLFEALQNVNGVRPQLNCNVCNTGDIHINGLEGPYSMVLIDGMPVVSGLSTVYGLSGIPQSLIERVELVKGPASTLYGSEAVGGLINVITKTPTSVPTISADIILTSWSEINADVAGKFRLGKSAQSLIGLNAFNYGKPIDNNDDGFTDVTLQNRLSLFNKWHLERKYNRIFSLAGRLVLENRWGGEMEWNEAFRGGDSIYGESIDTRRWEFFGLYQLPMRENVMFRFSANGHNQNSFYGSLAYIAQQYTSFGQLTWNKTLGKNDLMTGSSFRYAYYDDNTFATSTFDTLGTGRNMPSHTYLPGIFVQDEISMNDQHKVLVGVRYDYNSVHGSIVTPRINYKWSSGNRKNILRFSAGSGYRVANVFTEDHAALTGSRQVDFLEDLKPETSWNGNVNYVRKFYAQNGMFLGVDASAFYTYFDNKIMADYDTDPNKIIYDNLDGYAVSKGFSLNLEVAMNNGLNIIMGGTLMDVSSTENGTTLQQMLTENFSGVWNIGYTFKTAGLSIDYTGNVYSPMRLPLLGESDPRAEYSPWWSLQNIQLSKKSKKGFEVYGGVKNLLNWTPNKGNDFIIARADDPFDRNVIFDANGQAIVTPGNPYGLTFDPTYVYGPNQGIRGFFGVRYTMK